MRQTLSPARLDEQTELLNFMEFNYGFFTLRFKGWFIY